MYRKAKPCEDGPLETNIRDPLKNVSGGAQNPYLSNQDISKWHFSAHGGVAQRFRKGVGGQKGLAQENPSHTLLVANPLRQQLSKPLTYGIPLERAVRIDVSSANCRAKSHFQVRTSVRNPIFRCPPLKCPPLGPPEFHWSPDRNSGNL